MADVEAINEVLKKYNLKLYPKKCAFNVSSGKFPGFIVSRTWIEVNPAQVEELLKMAEPHSVKEVQSLMGRIAAFSRFIPRMLDKYRIFTSSIKKSV